MTDLDRLAEMAAENLTGESANALLAATPALIAVARAVKRLRPEVLAFAHLMETKLREHDEDNRRGWNDPSIGDEERDDHLRWLWDRLSEEANEVDDALREYIGEDDDDDEDRRHADQAEHAAWEAVDVANFAMMIADVLGALTAEAPAEPDSGSDPTDDREEQNAGSRT